MQQIIEKVESLRLGKMTTRELASWMGIKYETWRISPDKRWKKLMEFCQFDKIYGGAIIKKIKYPYFSKNPQQDIDAYYQVVKNTDNHLCTISGISEVLNKHDDNYKDLTIRQVQRRMSGAGKVAFGQTKDEQSEGIYGSRHYVWAIKESGRPNSYRNFTEREYELFKRLTASLYSDKSDKVIELALLDQRFRFNDDMTKQEYFMARDQKELDLFYDVIALFKERTGLQIVRATQHELNNNINEIN